MTIKKLKDNESLHLPIQNIITNDGIAGIQLLGGKKGVFRSDDKCFLKALKKTLATDFDSKQRKEHNLRTFPTTINLTPYYVLCNLDFISMQFG